MNSIGTTLFDHGLLWLTKHRWSVLSGAPFACLMNSWYKYKHYVLGNTKYCGYLVAYLSFIFFKFLMVLLHCTCSFLRQILTILWAVQSCYMPYLHLLVWIWIMIAYTTYNTAMSGLPSHPARPIFDDKVQCSQMVPNGTNLCPSQTDLLKQIYVHPKRICSNDNSKSRLW